MAQVVQSSVRFVGSHMQYTQDLRLPNLRLKTKYDRQGEASLPSLNKSFEISPGYHLRSIPLSGPTQSLRYIHDPDSWYWTSAQVRWLVDSGRQNLYLNLCFRSESTLNIGAWILQSTSGMCSIDEKWPNCIFASSSHLGQNTSCFWPKIVWLYGLKWE